MAKQTVQEQIAAAIRKQLEKPTIPPLIPIGSLQELALFIEPVLRQAYVLLVANPTGFFYTSIHVPCGYPLILPPFYPVTLCGPAPAGAFALPFIDPTLPYCDHSEPCDPPAIGMPFPLPADPDIIPCPANVDYTQYAACVAALNKQMRSKLKDVKTPPELQKLLDLIANQVPVPLPETIVPAPVSTEKEIEILVEDGIDGLFEGINIIE